MNPWRLHFLLGVALLLAAPSRAQYIWINVSFKAVLNPTNGTRSYTFTVDDIDATIGRMNATLAAYQRGYRVRRVDPLYDIGGMGDATGPSKWYSANPRDPYPPNPSVRNQEQMDNEARSNSLAYRWNPNALNYYVVAGFGTSLTDSNGVAVGQPAGEGSFPSGGFQIVTLGTVHSDLVILHETGHWLELYHTHGNCVRNASNVCGSPGNCDIASPFFDWRLGDDQIADTLPTQAGDFCFTSRDNVSAANFGVAYRFCTPEQQTLVDDTYFNLMAYGFSRVMDRLTSLQLDKWTRYANNERAFAMSGRTRFVSAAGDNANSGLVPTAPKRTVLNAANVSTGNDIVLLRPGSYNEQITLSQPVTLRVAPTNSFPAYARSATIGRP
jgi:hypothetical protein